VPYRVVMIGAGFGRSGMGVAPQPGRMALEGQVRHEASRASVGETGCHNWYTTSGRISHWPAQTSMYGCRVRHFDLSDFTLTPGRTAATAPGPAGA
jgi:hypothetical protein